MDFGVPIIVENDVNAAAIGEAYYGAAIDCPDFLCLTFGTGVGGAIVSDGKLLRGADGAAGEFGQMKASKDCFYEEKASVFALVQAALEIDPSLKNGRLIIENLENKDVRAIFDAWINEIITGLVSLTHIFNPPLIILGGGIMENHWLVKDIDERLKKAVLPSFSNVKTRPALLGNRAGMYGAHRQLLELMKGI